MFRQRARVIFMQEFIRINGRGKFPSNEYIKKGTKFLFYIGENRE